MEADKKNPSNIKHQKVQDPFLYNCTIQRIVDGDTVDVNIDLGFGIWLYKERIRIAGIDTPEKRTRDKVEKIFGLAATAKAHTLIAEGSSVIIRTHRDKAGKYGRTMGDFILEDGSFYTSRMIQSHHAVPYEGQAKSDIEAAHLVNREILIESGEITVDI
jgi:micrococcal nuclease|tara:strand:+ start:471 stop:950 length:480 start_codon:yes stop_codon:yes gene_type:complete